MKAATQILTLLEQAPSPLTVRQIAEAMDRPRSSVARIVCELLEDEIVHLADYAQSGTFSPIQLIALGPPKSEPPPKPTGPVRKRILQELLGRSRGLTSAEIASAIEAPKGSVRGALTFLVRQEKIHVEDWVMVHGTCCAPYYAALYLHGPGVNAPRPKGEAQHVRTARHLANKAARASRVSSVFDLGRVLGHTGLLCDSSREG